MALRVTLLTRFLSTEDFTAATAQLVLAVLLGAEEPLSCDALAKRMSDVIATDGWQCDDRPPDHWTIYGAVAETLRVLIALDLNTDWPQRGDLIGQLTSAGQPIVTRGLRAAA